MIKKLTPREHIIKRPSVYIGGTNLVTKSGFIFTDEKLVWTEYQYVPALMKIINEIIDNCVDTHIKNNTMYQSIDVEVDKTFVSVKDNSVGIPVIKNNEGDWMPTVAWGESMSGSNFEDDENRTHIGLNGIGSFATNCFSNFFRGETCDGSNRYVGIWENGLLKSESVSLTSKKGSTVKFEPNFSLFECDKIDETHQFLIKQRLLELSLVYPHITFTINKKKIAMDEKSFMKNVSDTFVLASNKNVFIGIYPNTSEDFSFYSVINGLSIINGGTHIDYIINKIVPVIRNKISKKYKEIKPAEIKNRLAIVVIGKSFPNLKFDSQTKEKITNSASEVGDYYKDIDFDKLAEQILKQKEIMDQIIEIYKIKEEFNKRKNLSNVENQLEKVKKNPKLIEAQSNDRSKCTIFITEGLSAIGRLSECRNKNFHAGYPLRGKFISTFSMTEDEIIKNQEAQDLLNITGLKLTSKKIDSLRYGKICILTDNDTDGDSIFCSLMVFFNKFWPDIIAEGRLQRLMSPLIVAKKGKTLKNFFSLEDFKLNGEGFTLVEYNKGLGSLELEQYSEMINNGNYITIRDDENAIEKTEMAFGDNTELRKVWLLGENYG